jgi:ketosteroid isomerase-like protein
LLGKTIVESPNNRSTMAAIREADSGIDALYVEWRDAFVRQDINAILELLTPDYVLWTPGAPPMTRQSLASRLAAAFSSHYLLPSFEREEQLVVR